MDLQRVGHDWKTKDSTLTDCTSTDNVCKKQSDNSKPKINPVICKEREAVSSYINFVTLYSQHTFPRKYLM